MDSASLETINHIFIHYPIFTISVGVSALIGTFIYLFGFSRYLRLQFKRSRMKHRIDHLRDHYIICGFGRVGQQIVKELASEKEHFVIIEREEEKLKSAKESDWPYLLGDVALDESLFEKARIGAARAVIIAVGSDADAIFMAVSARALRKDIFIVARASSVEAADKLTKIGVNRIALPYQIGGYHMATMAMRPTVVDILDLIVDQERDEMEMEEITVTPAGPYDGKPISDLGHLDKLAIVAVRKQNGKAVVNPADSHELDANDRLVILGPKEALDALTKKVDKEQQMKGKPVEAIHALPQDVQPSPFQSEKA